MISYCYSTLKSLVSASTTGLGMVGTVHAAQDIADGNVERGLATAAVGMTCINVAEMGQGDGLIQASTVGGMGAIAAKGCLNICEGIKERSARKTLKGATQLAVGAAGTALAATLPAKVVSIASQSITLAGMAGLIAYSGVKDIASGKYLKGVAKTAFGVAGIATCGWCAYQLLKAPVQVDEYLENLHTAPKTQQQTQSTETTTSSGKRIKLATVYNNKNRDGSLNTERQKISDIVVPNHRRYADKWNADHDVVTQDLVAGQCTYDSKPVDCSAYMNKIQYYRMQCADPAQEGKLVVYCDDDLVFTNLGIDPVDAFNRLRNGKDTSVVMMREGADWAKYFPVPGYSKKHDPRISANTGFIMGRIDPEFCQLIEDTWEARNTPMDPSEYSQICPTIAYCGIHAKSSLGDQTAMAKALQDMIIKDPERFDRTVTIVLPRDISAAHRADISFNTLHRDGCHSEFVNGKLGAPYDIGHYDRNDYPDGMWKRSYRGLDGKIYRDWTGQTAGFTVMGKYPLPGDGKGRCWDNPEQPIENIRLKKVLEMLPQKDFTFIVAHARDKNSEESQYSHITLANHQEYARRHGAQFLHVTDANLVKDRCTHPVSKEKMDCSLYMMKVQALRTWLRQPATPGREEWACIADDDGFYASMSLKPSDVLEDLQGASDPSFIIAEEVLKSTSPANTGLIFVRRDPKAQQFVEWWWNERNTATSTPNDPTCPTHGTCKHQKVSLNDQSCLGWSFFKHPEAVKKGVAKIVPIQAPDRPYKVNSVFRKGCWYRNQADWVDNNAQTLDQWDQRETPSGVAEPGDEHFYFQAPGVPRVGRFCDDPEGISRPLRRLYIEKMATMVKE